MKDIELIEKTLDRIAQMGDMEIEIQARDLERICKLALEQVKNCSISVVVGRSEQLLCCCDNPNGFKEMEEGRQTCSKCKKPY